MVENSGFVPGSALFRAKISPWILRRILTCAASNAVSQYRRFLASRFILCSGVSRRRIYSQFYFQSSAQRLFAIFGNYSMHNCPSSARLRMDDLHPLFVFRIGWEQRSITNSCYLLTLRYSILHLPLKILPIKPFPPLYRSIAYKMSSLFFKIAIALSAVSHVMADDIITPYGDSECREPISDATMDELGSTNVPAGTSIWDFTVGWPTATNWDNVTFPSANSSYGGSGKEVWWKVPQLRGGCSVVLMEPFLESGWGTVDPNQARGNVIINTQSGGCLYSSLYVGNTLTLCLF